MKSAEYETPVQTCAERRREGAGERRWSEMVLDVHIVRECSEHLGKKLKDSGAQKTYSTVPIQTCPKTVTSSGSSTVCPG